MYNCFFEKRRQAMATVIKVPVSKARTQLSQIVRQVCEDPDLVYQITVNESVMAEISSPVGRRQERGGEAAQALLEVARRAVKRRGQGSQPKHNIAAHHNDYLYGKSRTGSGSDGR
jgi:hypothetical protein